MEETMQQAAETGTEAPVDPARAALVQKWTKTVLASKKHFESDFKRMRTNMKLFETGADDQYPADHYKANITNRVVNQKVSRLYARNPRVKAERKRRLEYTIWDGRQESIQEALQQLQMAAEQGAMMGAPPAIAAQTLAPQAVQLVQDIQQAQLRQRMMDRVGKTLEILTEYFMDEGNLTFKEQAKQLVRRTKICSVGYVKLNFQRLLENDPSIEQPLHDATQQLARIEALMQEMKDGDLTQEEARAEELRQMVANLQAQPQIVTREGLVFDFPRSTAIIVDKECTQLSGFVGAGWIAHEMVMSPERVKELYDVDITKGKGFTNYKPDATERKEAGEGETFARIWEIQDKRSGLIYTVCEGYCDFLHEPKAPDVWLSRFFNVFALTFNELESETRLYPPADVELMQPMQEEYNRARQGLREHRARNRPGWVSPRGALEQADKDALTSNVVNAVTELNALQPGQDVKTILQPKPTAPIDPNLYDVNQSFSDVQRVVGLSETHMGELTGATATETSVGEQSRQTEASSDVDDLDGFLSSLVRAAGEILLVEMSEEKVKQIAGPGAVWPSQSRQEIASQVYLAIQAGSSGRPNKAQELANFERAAPWMVQIPGINPTWFGRRAIETLWEDVEIEEAIAEGMPSITALNSMAGKMLAGPSTGDPRSDPGAQGSEGGQNAPNPQSRPPGPQPAYPAP